MTPTKKSGKKKTSDQKQILIIEDEAPMSKVLTNKFETSGFAVHHTSNGKDAIELLLTEKFDLVLLDLLMPGKDGFSILTELKGTQNRDTPVFVLTNVVEEEQLEKACTLGAAKCFMKAQVSLNELVEEMKLIES